MSNRTLNDSLAPPLVWGPWSAGDAIITKAGKPLEYTLNFTSISNLSSSYRVEVRYFNGTEFVTESRVVPGSGSITVTVGGGQTDDLFAVKFRLKSDSIGQVVKVRAELKKVNEEENLPNTGGEEDSQPGTDDGLSEGFANDLEYYEEYLRTDPEGFVDRWHCFSSVTPISLPDGSVKQISDVRPGDIVLAFDPAQDNGQGALRPCRVTRLFHNSTEEWIELSNGLTVTPGHHFLDAQGGFRTIEDILATDGTIVLEDGSLQKVTGRRIHYSGETAHLYEESEAQIATRGALALAPAAPGWQTYNFEVEGLHTYVAGGVRVHNRSTIGEHIVNDLELAALEAIFGDDIRSIELPDGSGGGVQLV